MSTAFNLLVIGQSNAANHGPTRGRVDDPRARAFFDGRFLPLHDPIPGGTGEGGSVWTRLAPRLLARGDCEAVTIALAAVGGAAIADLAPGGADHDIVTSAVAAASRNGPAFSHVLFHQGERDTMLETTRDDYRCALGSLIEFLRSSGVAAPVFVCRASYRFGVTSEAVRAAQGAVIEGDDGVFPGPDTDLLGESLRADNTHFSDAGLERFADAWIEALTPIPAPDHAQAQVSP